MLPRSVEALAQMNVIFLHGPSDNSFCVCCRLSSDGAAEVDPINAGSRKLENLMVMAC